MSIAICVPKKILPELRKIPGLFDDQGEVPECNLGMITEPEHQEAITFIQINTISTKVARILFTKDHPDYYVLCLRKEV